MVLDDTRTTYWSRHLSLVTNGQKAWMKRSKISDHVRRNYKHTFSHSTELTYQIGSGEPKAKFFGDNGKLESTLWAPGTPCRISCCMMPSRQKGCCWLWRAKSFCRTCAPWKEPRKRWSAATDVAFQYHLRHILWEPHDPLRIGDHPRGLIEVLWSSKPRISFKLFDYG